MSTLILGIDDAGRGPVIGPMVLAGCLVDSETEKEFKKLGVKDSKQLTQKRREFLEKIIKEKVKGFETVVITPNEIDTSNKEGIKLNEVEALAAAKIINKLNPENEKIKVIVDCPSVSIKSWQDYLKMHIKNLSNLEVSCEHKADINHVSVSAASILAKSQREREMDKLKKEFGDEIGSGYGADPVTKKFLAKNAANPKHTKLFRKTWSNWQKANQDSKQKKLF
ncbi:MAG: ribonuclease HII [Nanoarchaeota archaeon]